MCKARFLFTEIVNSAYASWQDQSMADMLVTVPIHANLNSTGKGLFKIKELTSTA